MQKAQISAVIIVIAVICLALGVTVGYGLFSGKVTTRTVTSTETTTSITQNGPTTITRFVLADCSNAQSPTPIGLLFGAVLTGNSPAIICIQFYYYNSASPTTLDLSGLLSIDSTATSNAAQNFTLETSQSQLVIGGFSDQNEGAIVAFAITANAGASGTYGIGVSSSLGLTFMISPSDPVECGEYGELVAGNGQPYYFPVGGCLTYTSSSSSGSNGSSDYHTISGIQYPLLNGNLYFRIVGVINSTK